jgi:hypothetical protein
VKFVLNFLIFHEPGILQLLGYLVIVKRPHEKKCSPKFKASWAVWSKLILAKSSQIQVGV